MRHALRFALPLLAALFLLAFVPGGTAKIKGKVSSNASPVPQAALSLLQNGKLLATSISDASGNYQFEQLSAGTYDIKVAAFGYKEQTRKAVQLKDAQTLTLDFSLQAVSQTLTIADSTKQTKEKETLLFESKKAESRAYKVKTIDANGCAAPAPAHTGYLSLGGKAGATYQWSVGDNAEVPLDREGYDKINDNGYKLVGNEALSTFSADVDRASYSNVRRFLNTGSLPPKDAVRIEEMINYFSYSYPQPEGDDPFSITMEYARCPWNAKHQLVHIGLQGKRIETDNLPFSNLTFLIDVSGSMQSADKLPLVKASLRLLVNELRPQDKVSLVVYAGAAGLVLEPTAGNQKDKILQAIDALEAGGSTAGGAGINLAYKTAKQNFLISGNNRVILCTDGDFNVGVSSDAELERLIEEKRRDGIFLTVLGYGTGNYQDAKMEKLADKGNGNYAYIDNLQEANKTLVSEMGATLVTIAKDVKIQVEFNPAKVKAYRLIGYENRLLNKEDFNDDKKDAGELGAGHTVTALYEIVPAESDEVIPGVDPLKYQQPVQLSNAAKTDEVLTIKFRYKAPQGDVSKLITRTLADDKGPAQNLTSNNFRFACAVVQFGMLLRDSQYKGEANWNDMIAQAKAAKGDDDGGYRSEFIRLAESAKLLSGVSATSKN